MPLTRDEFRYGLRCAWVHAKDAVGLPRRGDRTFYVDQLARKLRLGELGRNIRITAAGKTDGAGAQALANISAMAFASAFGLDYVHSPFRSIEHAEGPMGDWISAWETTFNFGAGQGLLEASGLPIMPLGDFLKNRALWSQDFAVVMPHYLHWCNRNTAAYETVLPLIRRNYYRDGAPRVSPDIVIGVHLRRGDVSATKVAGAYTPNRPVASALRRVAQLLDDRGEPFSIRVFSQGAPEDFSEFAAFGAELCLDRPAPWTFRELVEADVLIMAKSSFSYVAGLLCDGVKIYEPYRERPLPQWIVRDEEGRFDEIELCRQVGLVLDAKRRGVEQRP